MIARSKRRGSLDDDGASVVGVTLSPAWEACYFSIANRCRCSQYHLVHELRTHHAHPVQFLVSLFAKRFLMMMMDALLLLLFHFHPRNESTRMVERRIGSVMAKTNERRTGSVIKMNIEPWIARMVQ